MKAFEVFEVLKWIVLLVLVLLTGVFYHCGLGMVVVQWCGLWWRDSGRGGRRAGGVEWSGRKQVKCRHLEMLEIVEAVQPVALAWGGSIDGGEVCFGFCFGGGVDIAWFGMGWCGKVRFSVRYLFIYLLGWA